MLGTVWVELVVGLKVLKDAIQRDSLQWFEEMQTSSYEYHTRLFGRDIKKTEYMLLTNPFEW